MTHNEKLLIALKNNDDPFSQLSEELQNKAKEIGISNFCWRAVESPVKEKNGAYSRIVGFQPHLIYILSEDYAEPSEIRIPLQVIGWWLKLDTAYTHGEDVPHTQAPSYVPQTGYRFKGFGYYLAKTPQMEPFKDTHNKAAEYPIEAIYGRVVRNVHEVLLFE